ncbi:MAG: hypothetical protein RIC04_04880 [Parvibaculum sp.]|uniref:hypothetical protein n=1 Tax=Parvibaculum sp. TaxID=2024848 RepID=UPI0032EE2885
MTAAKRLAALMLAAAMCAAAPAAGVPVWEPGDPLPDMEPDMTVEAVPAMPMARPDRGGRPLTQTSPAESRPEAIQDKADFLCARAPEGKTAPVPPPFDGWLVRVCAARGQALVPAHGEAWVAHGSADPISILALAPGATPPGGAGFDPRYDIRFTAFAGEEATEARRARADALLAAATSNGSRPPAYDTVWQLDALSNIALPGKAEGARYNLFFYVAATRPRHIIACLDECRQALYLDVLSGVEAAEVLGR